ncbi:TPA: hypothetical protein U3L57_000065 [Streptococcus agalactiae]|nr:hypothetical protein [Streptococcus agalactiae]
MPESWINIFKYFKGYLAFPIPLGVCLLISVVFTILFMRLQSNRRKDYELVLNSHVESNKNLVGLLEQKDKRISELEVQLHAVYIKTGKHGGN